MIRLIVLSSSIATLCGCSPPVDLKYPTVYDLNSGAPHLCIPPTPGSPAHAIHAVAGGGEVTLRGSLFEQPENTEEEDPTPILTEGLTVHLWQLFDPTLEPEMVLASAKTDANGQFELNWTPTRVPIGFQVEDAYIQSLSPTVVDRSPWGGDIVCAYWANADGAVLYGAPRGEEVQLIVKALGDLDPPQFVIREVGNDIGGDGRVASFEGPAFVDGFSPTPWVVDGRGGGLFEGSRLELQFTAISHPVEAPVGEAVYGHSDTLITNK